MSNNIESRIKNLCVVGDRLSDFSNNENVITISNLNKLIKSDVFKNESDKYVIDIGQGICEKILKNLHEFVNNSGLSKIFQINIPTSYSKSSSSLTHKHKVKNIMISDPTQSNDVEYQCLLMIEEYCAEMSDHITGQHIQGMVLIEAARQMVIAVTEKYFIPSNKKGKLNFITHSMDTAFHHFVFPLPVTIRYQILDLRKGSNNNLSSKALITFIQNEVVATEIIFKFSVLDSSFIAEKESYLAEKCIQTHFNSEKHDICLSSKLHKNK